MGQAQSNNFSSTVINSYASVLQSTTSSALQNSINQVKIGVSGGSGDVNISNVKSKQAIESSLLASFKQTNDSSIVQKVSQELQQQASSLVSGLNFGNYSESNNVINSAITASMDVSQTISTTCASTAMNEFILEVQNREGNINLDKIDIEQTIKNSMQCASESLNKSVASQVVENKIIQKATAETKGLDMNYLILIILAILLLPVVGSYVISKVLSSTLAIMVGFVLLLIGIEVAIYTLKLKNINENIAKVEEIIKANEKISQTKPQEQLKTFNFTCGLYGIGNYTGCFTPLINTKPPIQNISGCKFEEEPIDTIFTSPDDAYAYWLNKPSLMAIDIISRHNGQYEYHFYSKVSKECISLMDSIGKDPKRTTIPTLVCGMNDPVKSITDLSPSSVPEYTFVFSLDGFLYYTENKAWVRVNNNSVFTASSTDNITVSLGPPEQSSVEVDTNVMGTYYYIDMSKARKDATQKSADSYYYTVYTYDLGTAARTEKITLNPTGFVKRSTIDTTDLVVKKEIGPFMTNPTLLKNRNCTVIWDTDIGSVKEENQQLLVTLKKEQSQYKNAMIGVGVGGGFLTFIIAIASFMSKQKQTA